MRASCKLVSARSWRGARVLYFTCSEIGESPNLKSCYEQRCAHLEDAVFDRSTPRHPRGWPQGSMATAEKPISPDLALSAAHNARPVPSAACPVSFVHAGVSVPISVAICVIGSVFAAGYPSTRLHTITRIRKVCPGLEWRLARGVRDRTSQALHRSRQHIRRGESYSSKQEQKR